MSEYAVQIIGYHLKLSDEFLGHGILIEVEAAIGDSHGNEIGRVDTDHFEYAANLPLALVKTYFLSKKINSGKLQPAVDL